MIFLVVAGVAVLLGVAFYKDMQVTTLQQMYEREVKSRNKQEQDWREECVRRGAAEWYTLGDGSVNWRWKIN